MTEELERIAEKVIELTRAHDDKSGPYLVSKLGIDLGDDLQKIKTITSKGLREFIKSYLSGRATLVETGIYRNIYAITLGSAESATIDTLYFSGEQKKRFHFRFWGAFSVPLEKDIRVINMEDFRFEDVMNSEIPEGGVTIDREFIAPAKAENRDVLIKDNISRWLASKSLSEEQFLTHGRHLRSVVAPPVRAGGSPLVAVIAATDRT